MTLLISAISVVCPGMLVPCLDSQEPHVTQLVEASVDFMDGLYQTLIEPPLWKVFKTQGYRKLESAHSTIYRSVVEDSTSINSCCACPVWLYGVSKYFLLATLSYYR